MKLTDFKPTSATLHLKHPITGEPLETDEGNPVIIEIVGRDSQHFYNHQRASLKKLADSGKDLTQDITAEELADLVNEQIAACVVGWDKSVNSFFAGLDTKKGGGKYSHKLVKKIIEDGELTWLRDQIDEFLNDRANFFKR